MDKVLERLEQEVESTKKILEERANEVIEIYMHKGLCEEYYKSKEAHARVEAKYYNLIEVIYIIKSTNK